jgi:hypothetical protein
MDKAQKPIKPERFFCVFSTKESYIFDNCNILEF